MVSFSTIESRETVASHLGQEIQRTLIGTQIAVQPVASVYLRIVPQAIAVQPSQPFTFEIRVEPNDQTLIGVQAFLDFNPNSLQVVTVVMGTSSPLGIFWPTDSTILLAHWTLRQSHSAAAQTADVNWPL